MIYTQGRLRNYPKSRLIASISAASLFLALTPFASIAAEPVHKQPVAPCQKVYTEVRNADKVYIALQFGVVKAATDYLASTSPTNKLLYNDSFIKAIEAANRELNFAILSPKCYSVKSIAGYKGNVKSNLVQIANIYTANVNGLLVGDPKKILAYKPVGLIK